MKAMVTGGAGFIGSHLVEALLAQGAAVHVVDNLSTGRLDHVPSAAVLHRVDIRSEDMQDLIVREQPDTVFHLAAQIDVQRSVREPCYDADVNILGTVNVLEGCRKAQVKKIVYASSCAVYGDVSDLIDENNLSEPISFYGISKSASEAYIQVYSRLYGLSYTILRYSNVYGPRQTAKGEGGVIAIFIDRIRMNKPLIIFGDGEQSRDFVYVKDVVNANIAAINHAHQEIVQVSTSKRTTLNELAAMLSEIHGLELDISYEAERAGDIKHSCLDNRKAFKHLLWQPDYDIRKGLTEIYRSFFPK
jgi:UDP-glucose 4-epimerase